MKFLLLSIFILLSVTGIHAQNYRQIDIRAAGIDASRPDELALKLTAPYKTDIEKFRSIFSWITTHVDYNLQRPVSGTYVRSSRQKTDTSWDSRSLDQRVAFNVLKTRTAVCDGYARLLKTLCDFAGLSCNVISGYAKTGDRSDRYFATNHTWNAIYLDGSWQLADVTWASGYIIPGANQYVRKPDESFFLTPPSEFIKNHYPEDPQWTLLDNEPVLREFRQSPFLLKAYVKNRIIDYAPSYGNLQVVIGDTIHFTIKLADISNRERSIAGIFTPMCETGSASSIFLQPDNDVIQKEINYTYEVKPGTEWLNIVYSDDVIMRYHLEVQHN
jgi:hypothetical protein